MKNSTQKSAETSGGNSTQTMTPILWIAAGVFFLALLFARAVYPEGLWLSILTGLALVGSLVALVIQNQKALKSRSAAYGFSSGVTVVLVLGIVGVLNFLSSRYPAKWDLTANKKHTLSDQSIKLVKGLSKSVKVTLFSNQRDRFRPVLDNYKTASSKFEYEFVDPFREPIRFKSSGLKKPDSAVISVESREDKIDDITEEKITNTLIKLLKDKSPVLCVSSGHGEKNVSGTDAEGYDSVKKALTAQYYEVKEVNLVQEAKLAETCDALAILGPTKTFFEPEVKNVKNYLEAGGRAMFALDLNLKGSEYNPELVALLEKWYIKPANSIIVDPFSKAFGLDATVALAPQNAYSRDSAITKEFRAGCIFPIARPLELLSGAPAGLKTEWLARTTADAFGSKIEKGSVHVDPSKDRKGPYNLMVSVEGKQKDSQATKNTRIVVFSTSNLATNQFSRMGGNLDLFVNSVSWVMEDESLISIRAKEDVAGKIEMSQKSGNFIALLTILVLPMLIGAGGLSIWLYRRKL